MGEMMRPTMKFRWKKVDSICKLDPDIQNAYGSHHILQQWWECDPQKRIGPGEWRDVPIESEK